MILQFYYLTMKSRFVIVKSLAFSFKLLLVNSVFVLTWTMHMQDSWSGNKVFLAKRTALSSDMHRIFEGQVLEISRGRDWPMHLRWWRGSSFVEGSGGRGPLGIIWVIIGHRKEALQISKGGGGYFQSFGQKGPQKHVWYSCLETDLGMMLSPSHGALHWWVQSTWASLSISFFTCFIGRSAPPFP